jgi:nucleoside 2-deoxyribosyltransferase
LKVYLAVKYHADHANRSRIEGITTVLEAMGYETVCVTRDLEQWGAVSFTPGTLMARSFDAIDACDFMVVDLTEKGVGVGIEAGYAHARHVPIITIAQTGAPISETLRGISKAVFSYAHYRDLVDIFLSMPAVSLIQYDLGPEGGLP